MAKTWQEQGFVDLTSYEAFQKAANAGRVRGYAPKVTEIDTTPEPLSFEAEWNNSPDLQSEFISAASYAAFKKADMEGRIFRKTPNH